MNNFLLDQAFLIDLFGVGATFASDDKLNFDLIIWCKKSVLKRKCLNELFETQDFRPATQKGQ